jgi:hypothetical protein
MPGQASRFKDKLVTFFKMSVDGQFVYPESGSVGFPTSGNLGGGGNFKEADYAMFSFCTGGANGFLSDIAPIVAPTTQTLIDPRRCPLNMRPYLTRLDICVNGAVPWSLTSTSVPFLSIQDTLNTPLVHMAWSALGATNTLTFPDSARPAPMVVGPAGVTSPFGPAPLTTFTYSAGVITLASDVFSGLTSENQMVGTPVEIIDGKGIGQTAYITACASGALTLNVNWGAYGTAAPNSSNAYGTVAPDTTTSVIAIYWQPLKTYTSATPSVTLENLAGTPYTAGALDNGFSLIGVAGTGQGQVRPVIASTNAGVCTFNGALSTAFVTTSSIVCLSNENNLMGAVDMCCGDKLSTAQLNTGLQVVVSGAGGSTPLGSNVRIYGEGYWAA